MNNKNPICPWCYKSISGFRDKLSLKEFRISGLCQECQDATFKVPNRAAKSTTKEEPGI